MFSQRTHWSQTHNALTLAVAARRAAGLPILDLTATNPTQVDLPLPMDEVATALFQGTTGTYDPQPFGLLEARHAVAAYHHGKVPAEHIVLTASTSEAYSLLFKLLCDPGDRVLVPAPSYPLFEYLAVLESVQPVPYPSRLANGEWHIDFETLRDMLDERTRAILLVSPNNPTGAVVRSEEVLELAQLCQERGMALVCDEVFADTMAAGLDDRMPSLAGLTTCLTFVLSGLSKVCLLPQLKLGWMAASGPADSLAQALARLEILADTYLSVATPVQRALPRLLDLRHGIQATLAQRLAANRRVLQAVLVGTTATLLPADGGWSAVLRIPRTKSEEEWTLALLEQDGVLVHPGWFFDFATEAWLILSLLPPQPEFAQGVERLAARLADV